MSLLELLALAAAVFVLTAGTTAWALFELRTPPVLADLGPEEVQVFATWDDEVFNRGTYVATPHGFRPVRYERYHAATIFFTWS